jgi:hypothetical protein
MKLKKLKPLFLQVGILLFIIAVFFFILEQQKQFFTVDFSKQYKSNKTVELAGFEEGELWRGNYSYDSERVLEGKSSIIFSSWYGALNSITRDEIIKLSDGYTKGYISLFVFDKKNLDAIDTFKLILSDGEKQDKEFDLTPLLHVGWNRVPVVVPTWKKIGSISLSITSKAGEIAEVNLDRFWIENTSQYTSEILVSKSQSLSLRTIGERTYLYSASPSLEDYMFITPTSIQKGSVTVSLIPEHAKQLQLAVGGTTMRLLGKNFNECTLLKNNDAIATKTLHSTSGKNDLYVFVKAEFQGKNISYSISNNGVDYEECGVVQSVQKTPIHLFLQGSYLLDSYAVEY